jgi:hypothetical protein
METTRRFAQKSIFKVFDLILRRWWFLSPFTDSYSLSLSSSLSYRFLSPTSDPLFISLLQSTSFSLSLIFLSFSLTLSYPPPYSLLLLSIPIYLSLFLSYENFVHPSPSLIFYPSLSLFLFFILLSLFTRCNVVGT